MNNKTYLKFAACAVGALLCTACGTYPLGYSQGRRGQTKEQLQLDMLTCKDEAHNAASSGDRQAGAFLLGMTIVGVPLAYELEKQKTREVYGTCMQARGYTYTPPTEAAR